MSICSPCDGYGVKVDYTTGKVVKCPHCDGEWLSNNEFKAERDSDRTTKPSLRSNGAG